MAANKPVKTIRVGAITLSIWENETKNGVIKSVNIIRNYKTEKGWEQTNSFREGDLAKVKLAIDEAMKYLFLKEDKTEPEVF